MWGLGQDSLSTLVQTGELPLITYEWLIIILAVFILLYKLMEFLLLKNCQIERMRSDPNLNSLEYSPFYHLTVIILILSELDWNMFDLAIWTTTYLTGGLLRKAIFNVKAEKDSLLGTYTYEAKLMKLFYCGKLLGLTCFVVGFVLFIGLQMSFTGINMKVTNLLVFPMLMVTVDGIFLFLSSAATEKDILCFYNQNINQILPTYKLEVVQKIASNSIRVWHFYALIRLFFGNLLKRMGVFEYIWIFSVVNACFSAVKIVYSCFNKYRNYNRLMNKFDRIFKKITSAPDQNCTICLTELLNCRQLSTCGHLFHYRCLFQWLQTKMECPICREPILLN